MRLNIIVLLLFLCGMSSSTFSQQNESDKQGKKSVVHIKDLSAQTGTNVYVVDTIINKFVGKWLWKQENETVLLTLTKITNQVAELEIEMIDATFQHTIDGKEVSNTLKRNWLNGGSNGIENTLFLATGFVAEEFRIEIINKNSIRWQVSDRPMERMIKNDSKSFLPASMILVRVK